ncbi:MAG: hypothetical protein HC904_04475 [Blastochloris sp.]|nr:hypothetical protein [Blastochloris sp.]
MQVLIFLPFQLQLLLPGRLLALEQGLLHLLVIIFEQLEIAVNRLDSLAQRIFSARKTLS